VSLSPRGGVWQWEQVIDGRQHRRSTKVPVGGKAERALAERRAGEFANAVRMGNFGYVKPKVPTVREWWERYAVTYLVLKGERTQTRDRSMMGRHALPYFGDTPLDQVTKSDCVGYMNARRAAYTANPGHKAPKLMAEGTVRRERQLIQAVFQRAVDDRIIDANPWKGIKFGRHAVRERVLLAWEQAKLMDALSPRYQRYVKVLLGTGCREDELRHVDPEKDLDLEQRTMHVVGKGRKPRVVPLSEPVVAALDEQLKADKRLWPQTAAHHRDMLKRAAIRAGIDHVSPHTMRHTMGHRWLASGGDIFKLSRVLGHASVDVTSTHYAHLLKEDMRAAMDARDLGLPVVTV
jgi:integrase